MGYALPGTVDVFPGLRWTLSRGRLLSGGSRSTYGMTKTHMAQSVKYILYLLRLTCNIRYLCRLLLDASRFSADTGYSEENFAYASTPFSSWVQVGVQKSSCYIPCQLSYVKFTIVPP
jgi:hypothetical protein